MKILQKITYKRDLPFTMKVKGKVFSRKTATLYFIESDEGIMTTEISPFPGLSNDSLQSCEYQFEKSILKKDHSNSHVAFSLFELNLKRTWQQVIEPSQLTYNSLCHYKNFTAGENATIKVKIDDDIESVLAFLNYEKEALSQHVLRLDANQQLTHDQVETIYKEVLKLGFNLEYFEEPLKQPKDFKRASYPFALDESLVIRSYFPETKALVFKPTQCFSRKIWSEREKWPLIISSTFDSIFTHATLLAMAQTSGHKKAHGLDHGHAYSFIGKLDHLSYNDVFPRLSKEHYQDIISKL